MQERTYAVLVSGVQDPARFTDVAKWLAEYTGFTFAEACSTLTAGDFVAYEALPAADADAALHALTAGGVRAFKKPFDGVELPTPLLIPEEVVSDRQRDLSRGRPALNGGGIAYVWCAIAIVAIILVTNQALTTTLYLRGEQAVRTVVFGSSPDPGHRAVYSALGIAPLPAWLVHENDIDRALRGMEDNSCNGQAVSSLMGRLQDEGFLKEAALIGESASSRCAYLLPTLYRSADIWTGLGDHRRAVQDLSILGAQYPQNAQYRFARGQNYLAMSDFSEALSDFIAAVSATGEKQNLSSYVYADLAEAYAGLGRYCEAVTSLQSWGLLDPRTNETPNLQALIEKYVRAGQCDREYASGEQRIPRNISGVNIVPVSVNGVAGRFILDTGASFVGVTASFARRAGMRLSEQASVQVRTANGQVEASVTLAQSVQVGKASARNVSVLAQEQGFGPGIDGLLGMSFLSRFDVQLTSNEIVLRPKTIVASH